MSESIKIYPIAPSSAFFSADVVLAVGSGLSVWSDFSPDFA